MSVRLWLLGIERFLKLILADIRQTLKLICVDYLKDGQWIKPHIKM